MAAPLHPWSPGDAISAARLRAMTDAINRIGPIVPGAGGRVTSGPGGTVVGSDSTCIVTQIHAAKITNAGPDSEADFDDHRYWVSRIVVVQQSGEGATDAPVFATDPYPAYSPTHFAVNLAEARDETHLLPVDTHVVLFRLVSYEAGQVPREFWAFVLAPTPLRWAIAADDATVADANGSYVPCNPCDDIDGTNPDTATSLNVYLPASGGYSPTVHEGDVIGYIVDGNGDAIAVTQTTGGPGLGTAQYQVYQMTTATVAGWDYVLAH